MLYLHNRMRELGLNIPITHRSYGDSTSVKNLIQQTEGLEAEAAIPGLVF